MAHLPTGELLFALGILFGIFYLFSGVLERFRIPGLIGAILIAMAVRYTPLYSFIQQDNVMPAFEFLSALGVLFLLFFIGVQIDLPISKQKNKDIILLTIFNTFFPFLLGVIFVKALGYSWILAFVIGLTRMPTAEAVVVPILDEFKMLKTKVGKFIIAAGIMDDLIEVFLVAFVSVWIGKRSASIGSTILSIENEIIHLLVFFIIFILFTWLFYKIIINWLVRWLPINVKNLLTLSILIMLLFGGIAEYAQLGMVIGAIVAGILMRPQYEKNNIAGTQTLKSIRSIAYSFLGPIFFFSIGMSIDLRGLFESPLLAILLFIAATLGKMIGALCMVYFKSLNLKEAIAVGVGLNARLTTEIVVAKILFDAHLINKHFLTALITASSVSTILVPITFAFLVKIWGQEIRSIS